MQENPRREKLAWLAAFTIMLMMTAGMLKLGNAVSEWLNTSTDTDQNLAMQRPEPAQNQALATQNGEQPVHIAPGGWAAPFFTPGPGTKNLFKEENTSPQPHTTQPNRSIKKQRRNKGIDKMWEPDYYEDGIDL